MKISEAAGLTVVHTRDDQTWTMLARKADKRAQGPSGETIIISEGKPYATLVNAVTILENDPNWSASGLRYNAFASRVEVKGQPVTDEAETGIALWMARVYGLEIATSKAAEAIRYVAHRRAYHPVREVLELLVWDRKPRLHRLLDYYLGAANTDLNAELSIRWAIGAVARALKPGTKLDQVLILNGAQGVGKSTALRILGTFAGRFPEWFSDSAIDFGHKDAYEAIHSGVWIWELAELASVNPRDAETVKMFLSSSQDRFRKSYARNPVVKARSVCFVGSSNQQEFLRDPTGSRRMWPVSVGAPRLEELEAAVEQLWAEAVALYRQGEIHWLDRAWSLQLQAHSEKFQRVDPWEVALAERLPRLLATSPGRYLTVTELLQSLEVDIDKQHIAAAMRMGGILTRMGWTKARRTEKDGRAWRWYPPEVEPPEPVDSAPPPE